MGRLSFSAVKRLLDRRGSERMQYGDPDTLVCPRETETDMVVRYGSFAFALLLIAVAFYCRTRLLAVPLERDEGGFAYIGQQLLNGIPPYASGNMKALAGIHFAYALIMAFFGETAEGIHTGLMLVNATNIVLLFILARRLLSVEGAAVAMGTYALLSVDQSVSGVFAHATHFVVLFVLAGLLVLIAALETERRSLLFAGGACFGLAVLMKQHGIFFCIFAAGYLVVALHRENAKATHILSLLSVLVAGVFLPYLTVCLYMLASGVFSEFWFWTFRYSVEYATEIGLPQGLRNLVIMITEVTRNVLYLWVVAGVGLIASIYPGPVVGQRWFVPSFFLFSSLAVTPGLIFYPHYFVLVFPALSLLAGSVFSSLPRLTPGGTANARLALLVGFFMIAISFVYQQREYLFSSTPYAVSRMTYGANPFPESVEIARYIRRNSSRGARIAVLGSEPQIYFYADRTSATDYLYMYSLVSPQPFVKRMQREMIGEIEAARPEYVVFVCVPTSWLLRDTVGEEILNWAAAYLERNYVQVGLAEQKNFWEWEYFWGKDAEGRLPASEKFVQVLRRNN